MCRVNRGLFADFRRRRAGASAFEIDHILCRLPVFPSDRPVVRRPTFGMGRSCRTARPGLSSAREPFSSKILNDCLSCFFLHTAPRTQPRRRTRSPHGRGLGAVGQVASVRLGLTAGTGVLQDARAFASVGQPLPPCLDEFGARLRQGRGKRQAFGHRRRHGGAARAGPEPRGRACALWRRWSMASARWRWVCWSDRLAAIRRRRPYLDGPLRPCHQVERWCRIWPSRAACKGMTPCIR
jgi:hypothetical protein